MRAAGPRTKLGMLLVSHLKSYYQTKKDLRSTYTRYCLYLKENNVCYVGDAPTCAGYQRLGRGTWGVRRWGRLISHSLFLTKYF